MKTFFSSKFEVIRPDGGIMRSKSLKNGKIVQKETKIPAKKAKELLNNTFRMPSMLMGLLSPFKMMFTKASPKSNQQKTKRRKRK